MIKMTKEENKLVKKVIYDSFDGNHMECTKGCSCVHEAMRRMARTILIVQKDIDGVILHGSRDLKLKIKKSLEEE